MTATQKVAMLLAKAKTSNQGGIIDQGTRKARRLYVGNLPIEEMQVTEEMLVGFFCAAATQAGIANTTLPGDPVVSAWLSQENKFAFVEFRTMEEATAGLGLNGITMGPNSLKVSRPSDYEDPSTSMMAMRMAAGDMSAVPGMVPGMGMPGMGMPGMGFPVVPPSQGPPSCVIRLTNMVNVESLKDAQDIADIQEDVSDECQKHGKLEQLVVPGPGEAGAGDVYVKFDTSESALNCKAVLHGRMFDGKAVQATFFSEEDFLNKKFGA
jgi:hypothetical protein